MNQVGPSRGSVYFAGSYASRNPKSTYLLLKCFFERLSPVLVSQFFRYGIKDGIVKRCAEFTRFFRAEFRKTLVIVVKAVQSIQDLGAGLGQVAHKTKMIAETQREGTVCAGTRWDSDVG